MKKLKLIFVYGVIVLIFATSALYIDSYSECESPADVAIVLGNKVQVDGQPSPRLKARLDAALDLYESKKVNKILVSGGMGPEGYSEGSVMADYLAGQGVARDFLLVDNNGNNTSKTSKNAMKIIGDKIVIAVSQQFHISRAKLSLRNAGFSNVCGYFPRYYEFRDIYSTFRELAAWVKYWAKGD